MTLNVGEIFCLSFLLIIKNLCVCLCGLMSCVYRAQRRPEEVGGYTLNLMLLDVVYIQGWVLNLGFLEELLTAELLVQHLVEQILHC